MNVSAEEAEEVAAQEAGDEGTEEESEVEEAPKPTTKKKAVKKPAVVIGKKEEPKEEPKVKKNKSQSIQDKMAAERRAKVAEAKKEIEKKDKVRFEEDEKQAEVSRKRVKEESAARTAKDKKVETGKEKTKAQARADRKAASAERLAARGRVRCPGSNLDVEKEGLALTSGGKLKENPWSKKGKRVRCPKCKRSVGIHTVGRKATQKAPTSYNLNTHYVKMKDGKPQVVKAKAEKKSKKVVTKAVKQAVVGKSAKVVKRKKKKTAKK